MIKWRRVFKDLVTGSARVGTKNMHVMIQERESLMTPHVVIVQEAGKEDVLFKTHAPSVPRAKQFALEYMENFRR